MNPKDVGYMTLLDRDYAKALNDIEPITSQAACDQFQGFLDKWNYWIDDETKRLSGNDWKWLQPLVEDCRKESVIPEDRHKPAMALLMPERRKQ